MLSQPSIPLCVVIPLRIFAVMLTVNFNNEHGFAAQKIDDEWANWRLFAKGKPFPSKCLEIGPEETFFFRHVFSQSAGAF